MSQYPIRTISELTGVPATTLRAWERRYGLLKPSRTAKGHRMYSTDDVDLINEIVRLLTHSHTISEAVRIIKNPELKPVASLKSEAHWDNYQHRMLKAIESFNEQKLDSAYNEALSLYPVDMITEHVILPLLNTLGERWQNRPAGIAEEHFFSAFLRNKVGARLHHESHRSSGSKILVCCLPGEYHELGILLFCIAAIGHGYRILYLGTDMPLSQLALVEKRTDISAILLSGTRANKDQQITDDELLACINSIEVPVVFGGQISDEIEHQISRAGAYALGSDHIAALEKLESIVPAFGNKK